MIWIDASNNHRPGDVAIWAQKNLENSFIDVWMGVEKSLDGKIIYVNGFKSNFERLGSELRWGESCFKRIMIFKTEEDKVKFILRWI